MRAITNLRLERTRLSQLQRLAISQFQNQDRLLPHYLEAQARMKSAAIILLMAVVIVATTNCRHRSAPSVAPPVA
jgi:hypothetical protein